MTAAAYSSIGDAQDYFDEFYASAPAAWSEASASAQAKALIRATRWLDQTYLGQWKGVQTSAAVTLGTAWPRSGAYDAEGNLLDSGTTPTKLRQACAEAAALDLAGTLDSIPDRIDSKARVASKSISAGGVSKSVTYIGGAPESPAAGRRFPKIDALVADLVAVSDTVPIVGNW